MDFHSQKLLNKPAKTEEKANIFLQRKVTPKF